jgi:hypothetical protein
MHTSKEDNKKTKLSKKEPLIVKICLFCISFFLFAFFYLLASLPANAQATTTDSELLAQIASSTQQTADSSMITSITILLLFVTLFFGGIINSYVGVKIQDPIRIRYKNEY